MPISSFVVTSNVDGHFAAAGFWAWRVLEQHGSLQFDQCTRPCAERLWPSGQGTGAETLQIDPATLRAEGLLPACPNCGALLRPNVLMFGDGQWVAKRAEEQGQSYAEWLSQVRAQRLVVVEIGAGTSLATIRGAGERMVERFGATLIRVNPDVRPDDPAHIALPVGALSALQRINETLPPELAMPRHQVVGEQQ